VVLPAGTSVADAAALASYRQVVSAPAPASGERLDAVVTLDSQSISFSYPDDVITSNPLQLAPRVFGEPVEPGIFGSPAVLYGSILLAFLALAIIVWAVASTVYGETSLDSLIARYAGDEGQLEDEEVQDMLVQTALLKRAVEATENLAANRGFLGRTEVMLERANVPVRAGEALFFASAAALLVGGGAWALTQNPLLALALVLLVPVIGYVVLQVMAGRRYKAFQEQLPDTLTLLAGTLRAGYSLPQGFDAVSNEVADPMGVELRRAMTETQLGRELEDALANLADRMSSEDFSWVVMALGIQREVGGNLAEVLVSVAETMIQRERLRREVTALTAEGRVSAAVLSLMPPGLCGVMWFLNPEYIGILFSEIEGQIALGLGVVMGLIGLFWMRKVIDVEA
jgi:tight adherence protein B